MNAIARAHPLDQATDHGNDLGVAHHLRPSVIVDLEATSRGSVQTGARVLTKRMIVECEVDRLLVNGQLTDPQWKAGTLFRVKWMACVKLPKVCATYGCQPIGSVGGSSADDVAARRASARQDVDEAIRALGLLRSNAVIAVCGMDESARGRVGVLRDGLDALREFYKVAADYDRSSTRGK
jgi:hypothetical protein